MRKGNTDIKNSDNENGEIIIYQSCDGHTKIDVKMQDETVWLTQTQIVELYQTSKSNVSEHIKHIFEDGELEEKSVVRNFRTTANDDKFCNTKYYNLDMIISLGYLKDYIEHLDAILTSTGEKILVGPGKVCHQQALDKARAEYKKYQTQTLSPVEERYLEAIKSTEKKVKKLANKTGKAVKK